MFEIHWLGRWQLLPIIKADRVDAFWYVSLIWGPLQVEISSYAMGVAKVECWNLHQSSSQLQTLLEKRGFAPYGEARSDE